MVGEGKRRRIFERKNQGNMRAQRQNEFVFALFFVASWFEKKSVDKGFAFQRFFCIFASSNKRRENEGCSTYPHQVGKQKGS